MQVVLDDRVTVLSVLFALVEDPHPREMLDVERYSEEACSEAPVEGREPAQVSEVEAGVLAGVRAASFHREKLAVRRCP